MNQEGCNINNENNSKVCSRCKQIKLYYEYYKDKTKKNGLRFECKECAKSYHKEYGKNYYKDNRNNRIKYSKEYQKKNKDNRNKYGKNYYKDNRIKLRKQNKEYYIKNKDNINSKKKIYIKNNKTKINKYIMNRKKSNPLFKLTVVCRNRISKFIKQRRYIKTSSTFNMIGCSPLELKEYLEKQFINGMSWANHGEWHIDHRVPLASVNSEEDILKLCHYTNLQPLWAKDNQSKGAKVLN